MKIYLPRVPETAEAPRSRGPEVTARGSETILVAEDQAEVRRVVTRMLEAVGYRILPASEGEEALRLLEGSADPVDLLLTDVVLPDMNGRVLAERAQAIRPGLKVLYTSGYTDKVALRHALLERGAVLVHKPFTAGVLGRSVRDALDRVAPA
jgi:CheY-like chemotaxis protein